MLAVDLLGVHVLYAVRLLMPMPHFSNDGLAVTSPRLLLLL